MVAQGKENAPTLRRMQCRTCGRKEDVVCGGSATREDDDDRTRYEELWGHAPDRTFRRGDVGAMIGSY